MYIVSKENEDYCRSVYSSRFGILKTEKQARVEIGNWITTTDYLFAMEAASKKFGISFITENFIEKYKEEHESWLQELKANVEKKVWKTTYVGGYSGNQISGSYRPNNNSHYHYQGVGYGVSNYNPPAKTESFEERKMTLIRRIGIEMLNEMRQQMSKRGLKNCANKYSEDQSDYQRAYRIMMNLRDQIGMSEIEEAIQKFPEVLNGNVSNYKNLTNFKQADIAAHFGIDPFFFEKALNNYIQTANSLGAN
jgi:hypothetical protein